MVNSGKIKVPQASTLVQAIMTDESKAKSKDA
jgi:hypothetical protein